MIGEGFSTTWAPRLAVVVCLGAAIAVAVHLGLIGFLSDTDRVEELITATDENERKRDLYVLRAHYGAARHEITRESWLVGSTSAG